MNTDALSLTLPIATTIGILGMAIWITFVITNERNRIDTRMNTVTTSVEHLAKSLETFARNIEIAVKGRYTVAEHELWCARTEALNQGWKSAEVPSRRNGAAIETPEQQAAIEEFSRNYHALTEQQGSH